MTFKKFLLHFDKVDLPIGDLARDVQGDPSFPESNDEKELYCYLESTLACDAALKTFENAFRYYRLEYPDFL